MDQHLLAAGGLLVVDNTLMKVSKGGVRGWLTHAMLRSTHMCTPLFMQPLLSHGVGMSAGKPAKAQPA
jgi:hypothetical protein